MRHEQQGIISHETFCYGLNVCPQNYYVEILLSNVMALGGEAFGSIIHSSQQPSEVGSLIDEGTGRGHTSE